MTGLFGCARGSDQLRRVAALSDALGDRPVTYSRALIDRVRATGELQDITDHMDQKAHLLAQVVRLRDTELTDYVLAAGEAGPAPSKTFVRQLAVGYLAHSNLWLNSELARQVLAERVRDSTDEREQLVLGPAVNNLLAAASGRAMALPAAPLQPDFIRDWIGWISSALERSPDPIVLELVLLRIKALGRFGSTLRVGTEMRELLRRIVTSRGVGTLTASTPGADRDVLQAALEALYDLDVEVRGYHVEALPRSGEAFDLWATYRDVPVTVADPESSFDALAATLHESPIKHDRHTYTRIRDAFGLEGVTPAKRTKLLVRLLTLPKSEVGPFDTTGMDMRYPTVLPQGQPEVFEEAVRALARDPAWIDRDTDVRRIVEQLAVRPFDTTGYTTNDHAIALLHPVFARLLRDLAQTDRDAGAEIMKVWMQSVRDVAARTDSHIYYATQVSSGRMLLIAALAPVFGLAAEARTFLDDMIAAPLSAPNLINLHKILLRSATIARRMLAE